MSPGDRLEEMHVRELWTGVSGMISAWGTLSCCSVRDFLSFSPTPLSDISRWRRKVGRQKEEGVTGEEMRFYMGSGGMEVTVPSWRQAGLLSKRPSLPAESFHPMTVPTSHQTEQDPPRQMLMARGRRAQKGSCQCLGPNVPATGSWLPCMVGGGLRVAKAPTSLWPPRTSS